MNTIGLGLLFKLDCFQNDSGMFTFIRIVVIQLTSRLSRLFIYLFIGSK